MIFFNTVIEIIIAILIVTFLVAKNRSPPNIILGIYRNNVSLYWPKYFLLSILIKLQMIRKRKMPNPNELDRPQPLSAHRNAIDAVYFNGSSSSKQLLVTGLARRKDNVVNGFMYLRVPSFSDQLLMTPKLPNTTLYQTEEEKNTYSVDGINLAAVEPMKKWSIFYEGKMKLDESAEEVDVKLKAEFSTKLAPFNYDVDMHPHSSADAIAKEIWSKQYFDLLKSLHQTHYEQYGDITGKATINGKDYSLDLPSVRDHSFGLQRNWKLFHRYVMHFLTLDNGDRVTVGVISIPSTFSSITVGFVTKAKENKNIPIQSCDLKLYQHGESGTPPMDYAFRFYADKKEYVVKVDGYLAPVFYLGLENECRIVEMMSRFTINGVRGWGAAEWQYRHIQ